MFYGLEINSVCLLMRDCPDGARYFEKYHILVIIQRTKIVNRKF